MNKNLVKVIEKTQIRSDLPSFTTGDTVKVSVRIVENGKSRVYGCSQTISKKMRCRSKYKYGWAI